MQPVSTREIDLQRRGIVFDVQRFALYDGPGIRTAVFLKGCPLSCVWCHNPESQAHRPQLAFDAEKCLHCLACVDACAAGVHRAEDGRHVVEYARCEGDGACVAACPHGALELVGRFWTVQEVLAEVEKDAAYYQRSGGGLTLSGGEPLAQFRFAEALLRAAHARGLHTCLDTSGAVAARKVEAVLPFVDLVLFDYKATDPAAHRRLTGVSNGIILANLDRVVRSGTPGVLRCPLVPGVNDDDAHLRSIAEVAARYPELRGVEVMAYHSMGRGKAARLGEDDPLAGLPDADEATKARWLERLHALGCTQAQLG